MIKRFIGICVAAAVLAVTGKMVSDYAETKPSLKNVKDKLKKTGKDFTADCKEVLVLQNAFSLVNFQQKIQCQQKPVSLVLFQRQCCCTTSICSIVFFFRGFSQKN